MNKEIEGIAGLILQRLDSIDSNISELKADVGELKADVGNLQRQVLIIENDHGQKLDVLFDGYKLLYEGQQEIKKTLGMHETRLLKIKEDE